MVDNHCKLLLIREETGSPSRQLSQWADVLLLVFSYADIDSLNQVGVGLVVESAWWVWPGWGVAQW